MSLFPLAETIKSFDEFIEESKNYNFQKWIFRVAQFSKMKKTSILGILQVPRWTKCLFRRENSQWLVHAFWSCIWLSSHRNFLDRTCTSWLAPAQQELEVLSFYSWSWLTGGWKGFLHMRSRLSCERNWPMEGISPNFQENSNFFFIIWMHDSLF